MEIKQNVTNVRAVTIMILFILFFIILLGRVVYVQMSKEVNGHNLKVMAEERWTKTSVIEGKRGTIYDRNGSAVAKEIGSYTMYAVLDKNQPNHVKKPKETAQALAPIIDVSADWLEERLSSTDLFQVELGPRAKNMSHEAMTEIKELDLQGIFFREEPRRYYPKQVFASHIIGYTERDMQTSRMGLELSFDEYLRGEDGHIVYQSDRKGIKLPNPEETIEPPKNGYDIHTTLDTNIQTALEQAMTKVEEEYSPEKIIGIVADPKTGQILAMSNRPSFNPNRYEEITNYINNAISDRFEPGSTMKIFTLAAAIEEGLYNGEEGFQSGSYQIGNYRISDHNQGRGWGKISFDEGFQRSSNVAFSILALEKLGPEKLYEYIEKFRFHERTGIDLPNEANGLIAKNGRLEAATTAFGQGTAVTPIQQVQAATAIANGGKMMKPYVIERIVDPETGSIIEQNQPEVVGEPISSQTSKKMLELLETVVTSSAGTGRPYYIEGFDVVGKTGTAQIPDPRGGYMRGEGKNIFSFLGLAPKDDPRLIVYVAVDRPKLRPAESGSAPVSMIFNTVMKQSLQYLRITPSMREMEKNIEVGFQLQDYQGQPINRVKEMLEKEGLDITIIGDGTTIELQYPIPGHFVLPGEKVMLRTNGENYVMPNIIGWSFRDVIKLTNALELKTNIFGSGFVLSQSIHSGSVVETGDYITVELEEPLRPQSSNDNEEEEEVEETEEEITILN